MRTADFRQPNRDGLLGRASAVFALADMVYFFADELTGLLAG